MEPTPTTRGRHALRWVLGVGLVFVVVVGMALQVARQRADERWESVLRPPDEVMLLILRISLEATLFNTKGPQRAAHAMEKITKAATSGGNIFQAWRQHQWEGHKFILVLRQERSFFGSSIEARMTGGEPALVDAARAIFAAVDVELVVEP